MKVLLTLQTNKNHAIVMPIDSEFPRNHQVIGMHNHADGKHYHFVWVPGGPSDAASNRLTKVQMSGDNDIYTY